MKKMKLDLDALTVETFEPARDAAGAPGTVHAHDAEPTPLIRTIPISDCFFSACATCGIYC